MLREIDDARGDVPRSTFVRRAVEESLPASGTLDVMQRLNYWEVDVLSAIREALEERERLQGETARIDRRIDSLVAAAREIRASWQSIGKMLGMSKQAAWERATGRATRTRFAVGPQRRIDDRLASRGPRPPRDTDPGHPRCAR